jgi:hypothetical protein
MMRRKEEEVQRGAIRCRGGPLLLCRLEQALVVGILTLTAATLVLT